MWIQKDKIGLNGFEMLNYRCVFNLLEYSFELCLKMIYFSENDLSLFQIIIIYYLNLVQ